MIAGSRVDIIRKKAEALGSGGEEREKRKIIVDFFRVLGIIDDKYTGSWTFFFNQGGMIGNEKNQKNPL